MVKYSNLMIDQILISAPKIVQQKPLIAVVQEVCEETDPKPLFCEIPEDLRLKPITNSGTVQTYTITSSSTASGYVGTSTTTTTP